MEEDKAPPSIAEANNILKIDSGEFDFIFHEWSDAKYMFNMNGDRGYSKYVFFNKK